MASTKPTTGRTLVKLRSNESKRTNLILGDDMGGVAEALRKWEAPTQGVKPPEVTALLTRVMQGHFLFAALHPDNLAELVAAMEKQEHSPGAAVVTQGESGEHFYVVQSGELEIVIDGKSATVHGKTRLEAGHSFGELALIHNGPRAATLRVPLRVFDGTFSEAGPSAAAAVVVYALGRTKFRRIVARQQAVKISDVKDTLKKISLLEGLSDANLATLAASVKIKDFEPGCQVIRRSDVGTEMYIVKKGGVVCEISGQEGDSAGGGSGGQDLGRQRTHTSLSASPAPSSSAPSSASAPSSSSPPRSSSTQLGRRLSVDMGNQSPVLGGSPPAANSSSNKSPAASAAAAAAAPPPSTPVVTQFPLGVGAWFGERALLFNDLRQADVYARATCRGGPGFSQDKLVAGADDGEEGCSCYTISAQTFKDVLGTSEVVLAKMDKEVKLQCLASLGIVGNVLHFASSKGRSEEGPAITDKLVSLLKVRSVQSKDTEPICRAGSPATHFFIVKAGTVQITAACAAAAAAAAAADGTGSGSGGGASGGIGALLKQQKPPQQQLQLQEIGVVEKSGCFGEAALFNAVRSGGGGGSAALTATETSEEVCHCYAETATVPGGTFGQKKTATLFSLAVADLLAHGITSEMLLGPAFKSQATEGETSAAAAAAAAAAAGEEGSAGKDDGAGGGVRVRVLSGDVDGFGGGGAAAGVASTALSCSSQAGAVGSLGAAAAAAAAVNACQVSPPPPPTESAEGTATATPLPSLSDSEAASTLSSSSNSSVAAAAAAAAAAAPGAVPGATGGSALGPAPLTKMTRSESSFEIELFCRELSELEVERTLGCGSFGRVKLATHVATKTFLALKILQKDTVVENRQTKNVSREKDIMAKLQHPNVLRLYGTFQDQDCLYMMLELVNGGELFRLMHGDGSEMNLLPFENARFYVAQVLVVYEYIHAMGIVYRDLKPENLLISPDGYLKVIDWGFAKEITDNTTYTMCGTPEYLAPEIVGGSGHGSAADFWALGVNLYEMVVGYSPFAGDDVTDNLAVCERIASGAVEWPEDVAVDTRLKDLTCKLLTQDPSQRFGCLANGVKDVAQHQAYRKGDVKDGGGKEAFDWSAMRSGHMKAPWVPDLSGGLKDVSNFDDIYDDEEEDIVPYDGDVVFDF